MDLTNDVMDGLGEFVRNGNGLATHVRCFRFTPAVKKMFLATYYTVSRATVWARQMSQGEASAVLD